MTISSCANYCISFGYHMFGLEYAGECFCGTALQGSSPAAEGDCNMACSGNSAQMCGGPNRLSVYLWP